MDKLTLVLGLGVLSLSASTMAAELEQHSKPGDNVLAELDSNGDGSVNFAEFQERGTESFARIDTNSDGELSIDEFLSSRPGPGMGMGMRNRGNRGDRNGSDDGRPQREPSEEQLARMQEMMEQRANEQFQEMNTDGDEFISFVEFQEANFLSLDRDNNGALTAEELRPQRRGPGPRGGQRGGQRGDRTPQV